MKLIIDIPEVFYEYCKAQEDAIEIQLAVKNGIPLDDLRAEIEALNEKVSVDYKMCLDKSAVLQIIDKYRGDTDEMS